MLRVFKNYIGEEDYRATMLVILGGFIGGFGAVLVTFLRPDPSISVNWVLQVCKILAGPIAALIAVLFILNTDRRDKVRLMLLAIICGLSGPAILVMGANIGLRLVNEQPLQWNYTGGYVEPQKG